MIDDMGSLMVFTATEGLRFFTIASVPLPWCTSKSKMHTLRTLWRECAREVTPEEKCITTNDSGLP